MRHLVRRSNRHNTEPLTEHSKSSITGELGESSKSEREYSMAQTKATKREESRDRKTFVGSASRAIRQTKIELEQEAEHARQEQRPSSEHRRPRARVRGTSGPGYRLER